jgi:hypothetical protein
VLQRASRARETLRDFFPVSIDRLSRASRRLMLSSQANSWRIYRWIVITLVVRGGLLSLPRF